MFHVVPFPVLLVWLFARPLGVEAEPRHYTCLRTPAPITIDGLINEPSWRRAQWTKPFVDIEGEAKPRPRFRTRAKMLWDDDYLYVAAELEEPHVWATLEKHDAVIFQDNDFEVFLDPGGNGRDYFELEINALNTTWDLFLPKPYKQGGRADNSWEIPGLRTAVRVNGTRNDPRDRERGWTLEMAIPWTAYASRAEVKRPAGGDVWRVNFSRVEWRIDVAGVRYRKTPGLKEDNWVWSPQGVIDMHVPERWGFVHFSPVLASR